MSLLSFITKEEPITSLADLELAKGKIQLTIMKMAAAILGIIMMSVVVTMMIGLFVPNETIDTRKLDRRPEEKLDLLLAFSTELNRVRLD